MGKDAFDGSKENASRFLLFLVLRNRFFPLCSLPFSSCSLLLHRQTFFHALRNFLFAHLASLFRPIDFAKTPHYRAPPCIFAPFHTVAFGSPSDHVRRSEGWRLMVTSWLLYGYMCRLYSSNYFFFPGSTPSRLNLRLTLRLPTLTPFHPSTPEASPRLARFHVIHGHVHDQILLRIRTISTILWVFRWFHLTCLFTRSEFGRWRPSPPSRYALDGHHACGDFSPFLIHTHTYTTFFFEDGIRYPFSMAMWTTDFITQLRIYVHHISYTSLHFIIHTMNSYT